jgi:hypothetical protein
MALMSLGMLWLIISDEGNIGLALLALIALKNLCLGVQALRIHPAKTAALSDAFHGL